MTKQKVVLLVCREDYQRVWGPPCGMLKSVNEKQPERRKLLLLVTDGEPADIDERDPQHLRHDTKKAVEELYSQGVLTYCLTLDPMLIVTSNEFWGQ